MKRRTKLVLGIALGILGVFGLMDSLRTAEAAAPANGIQWFSTLESGLAAAKQTNRPILFLSAAPHCAGVPGSW